jgi:hypothetical protein
MDQQPKTETPSLKVTLKSDQLLLKTVQTEPKIITSRSSVRFKTIDVPGFKEEKTKG